MDINIILKILLIENGNIIKKKNIKYNNLNILQLL